MPSHKRRAVQRPLEEGRDWIVDPATGCWEWQAFRHKGYARCTSGPAHREVWRQSGRLLADEDHLHHRCKNPGCVNPDHMQSLTPREHFLLHKLTEKTGLTLDDIRDIRQLGRTDGVRAKDVAERYGIHEITVFNYWGKEQVWADLLGEPAEPCRPIKTCAYCGAEFSHRYRNARYCSIEHRTLANQPRNNQRKREARRAA